MNAKVWVFEHPYHATTHGEFPKDKADDFGKYEIARIPTGVEVAVVAWHEGAADNWLKGSKGVTVKVADGKTETVDFSVKPKK